MEVREGTNQWGSRGVCSVFEKKQRGNHFQLISKNPSSERDMREGGFCVIVESFHNGGKWRKLGGVGFIWVVRASFRSKKMKPHAPTPS